MTKDMVREFVEECFEDILCSMCNYNVFKGMEVDQMTELDDMVASTHSFSEVYNMVVENGINVNNDYMLCLVDGKYYGYPSSEAKIKDKYMDIIVEQILDKEYTAWDDVAHNSPVSECYSRKKINLRMIREEVLEPKSKVYAMWHCDERKGNKSDVVLYSSKEKLLNGILAEIDCGAAKHEDGYTTRNMETFTLSEINDRVKYLYVECLEVR